MNTTRAGFGELRQAIAAGDVDLARALIERGVNLHTIDSNRYDALILAAYTSDDRLMPLLRLLIAKGVGLNGVTTYSESALRVLSNRGRFDAVRCLLEAGADESLLAWTQLIRATAIGSIGEVTALLDAGAPMEEKDWWSRTAWLVALQLGDLEKARLFRDRGADTQAVGRCAKPPFFYAISGRSTPVLRWLLEMGLDIEQTDEFGTTPLIEAAEYDYLEGIDLLIVAGAQIDRVHNGGTALKSATSRTAITRLLAAGSDPAYLSIECQRIMLGLKAEADASALDAVTSEQFLRSRCRRFGAHNAQLMNDEFWLGMIRSGASGYSANARFGGPSSFDAGPVWCAQRFGQSMTLLPDGRIVQIGGEHEDGYDPDFCIYNDVFVHSPDGSVSIYGYPEAEFDATDFHTATLCGEAIIIVGSLGYSKRRQYGQTPVYRLDTRNWRIERITTQGAGPGWIHGHRAMLVETSAIRITAGRVLTMNGQQQVTAENLFAYVLDIHGWVWSGREAE